MGRSMWGEKGVCLGEARLFQKGRACVRAILLEKEAWVADACTLPSPSGRSIPACPPPQPSAPAAPWRFGNARPRTCAIEGSGMMPARSSVAPM